MFEIMDAPAQEAVIKVIGVGGCGGNAVDHMITGGVKGVEFIVANTDVQALKRQPGQDPAPARGQRDQGPGGRGHPEIGRQAALEDREPHRPRASAGRTCSSSPPAWGGGTGTGAAPVVAEIAKNSRILTVAVVTRPFGFEGKRQKFAQEGLDQLAQFVDSLIVVPNEKLLQVLGAKVKLHDAFRAANDVLHARWPASPRSSAARA